MSCPGRYRAYGVSCSRTNKRDRCDTDSSIAPPIVSFGLWFASVFRKDAGSAGYAAMAERGNAGRCR